MNGLEDLDRYDRTQTDTEIVSYDFQGIRTGFFPVLREELPSLISNYQDIRQRSKFYCMLGVYNP